MSVDLTKMQLQILMFIQKAQRETGFTPSYREIGDAVGLKAVATVSYHLDQLQAKGYISRQLGKARAIRVK